MELPINTTKDLLKDYLEKFEVTIPQTLFEPDLPLFLSVNRCPLCNNKLHFTRNRKVAICSSKKHGKPFIIRMDKLKKFQR